MNVKQQAGSVWYEMVVLLLNLFSMACYIYPVSVKSATSQKCGRITQKSFASFFHCGGELYEGGQLCPCVPLP